MTSSALFILWQILPRGFVGFSLLFTFLGCGSIQKKDCQYANWYELGRQKGASGVPEDGFSEESKACKSVAPKAAKLYRAGQEAGLVQYCSLESAFELGLSDQKLPDFCLDKTGDSFLVYYQSGKRVLKLERENLSLDWQIRQMAESKKSEREIAELENKKAANLEMINQLKAVF